MTNNGEINMVLPLAQFMYEHWNYSAVELCTPKELVRYETPDDIPEQFHHYAVFAFKYSTITNILQLRCKEAVYGEETL